MPRYKPLPCPMCQSPKSDTDEYDGDHWRICRVCRASTRPCSSTAEANKAWNDRRTYTQRTGTK